MGEPATWEGAEAALRSVLEKTGRPFQVDEGGGAFYGPKIDLKIKDALGRDWQCGTFQLDFQLPERFELEYVAPDGSRQRPVMIHRALFGSIERFFAVLVEHYAGAFPTWLAPVQARFVPVADRHVEHCEQLAAIATTAGLRTMADDSKESAGRKIRAAQLSRPP